jgi:Protein kinase domain
MATSECTVCMDDSNADDDERDAPSGFFVVIERLVETLEQRIKRWQSQIAADQQAHSHSLFYRMSKEYKDKQRESLKERVRVATEIATVMAYLATRNVAFRDLKPDNIGFDRHGTLKLFDLGKYTGYISWARRMLRHVLLS